MSFSKLFLHLYSTILDDDRVENDVNDSEVMQAIKIMHTAYKGNPDKLTDETYVTADYNKPAYRCAYLFKYAPMHTALAYESMSRALTENPQNFHIFRDLMQPKNGFKICSLGSGPGTDVIGVLAALYDKFGLFPSSATLVDIMPEWEATFESAVSKMRLEPETYEILSKSVSLRYFDWAFIGADLVEEISQDLQVVIESSNLITLIKFVSAAACKKTSEMIEKIFNIMKPGAMVLFIDNAGGGFQQLITAAARKHHLAPIFGPLHHEPYVNETFNLKKFGHWSCYKTTVAVQLLMKLTPSQFSTRKNSSSQRFPALLQAQYAAHNIRMHWIRNEPFIPVPFDFNNTYGRHFVPFGNLNSFNFGGFNVLPQSYVPLFA